MDIGAGFNAPFKDDRWFPKAAMGGLWYMLVVTSPAMTGFGLSYLSRVARGQDTPLPEWSGGGESFGDHWVRGFMVSLGLFIYMLPAVIIMAASVLPVVLPILFAAASGGDSSGGLEALAGVGGCGMFAMMGVAVIYMIAVSILAMAGIVNYVMNGNFGAMFAFGDIFAKIRANTGEYFLAWVMSIVVGMGAGFVGGIVGGILGLIPCLGWLASFWLGGAIGFVALCINSHYFGQYAATAYSVTG